MQLPLTSEQKIAFKNKLKQFCQQTIQERIDLVRNAMADAQATANAEEKSSAGDKYETARAMSHLEKDMQARQLQEHLKELATIHAIDTSHLYSTTQSGAFLHCENISFFLGTGLGKQQVEDLSIIFLSSQAPLAKQLLHKKAGDHFSFNGSAVIIKTIF